MSLDLSAAVRTDLDDAFATLKTPYKWRAVTSYFKDEVPPRDYTSNVHVVPFVGDRVVLLHAKESGWGPSGGTLLEGEAFETCVTRELAEEIGGEATRFELFGQWDSETTAETAYRPWLPHPKFAIALGWADVTISGSSDDDGGIEMESILEVSILPIQAAVARLEQNDEHHLAALYRIAYEVRRAAKG
ncbi:NUDIX hydrolase [Streptomyces ipomoeae]|uniref:Hydrolase, NUDIX family n=1 Tax=Streptomyces ipomoeae 91-03 TaxID=698759 RepID=L1KJD6_9ACTN|nr:NUDIX domain-containing protein [Streptomyces ipomoeae]EKX60674.1 hydrolase, NUDIX family [Streptomyces ipomoeae 91-03]MDX2698695.1 NUDIX domain-containing protein [Streptomyces ipomoeae]MDX2844375.1 NUDIX domain-containing protein [Streptomyces ipomoeae]